jgi:predicted nucleotidyltransferase component of viral defense system
MSNQPKERLATSVRARLLHLAQTRRENFDLVLVRYAAERLLYRLSQSPYREQFVLKGGTLFYVWHGEQSHRPTRDIDLLGYGKEQESSHLIEVLRELCSLPVQEDGLYFDTETIRAEPIREQEEYGGTRLHIQANLVKTRIPTKLDIAYGDIITPQAQPANFPTMLDFSAPKLLIYPRETVVAEKYEAMVDLGMGNGRMKDFYDLYFLQSHFTFEGEIFAQAIAATFHRRNMLLPEKVPLALTAEFARNPDKIKQWEGFLRKNELLREHSLEEVVNLLHDFLIPPTLALTRGESFLKRWPTQRPWIRYE